MISKTHFIHRKIFVDFGPSFELIDVDGRSPPKAVIKSIDDKSVIEFFENHELSDGYFVKFSDIIGMTELNGREVRVKDVLSKIDSINFIHKYYKINF